MLSRSLKRILSGALVAVFACMLFVGTAFAAVGTIDPSNAGDFKAQFLNTSVLGGATTINFGKFTGAPSANVTVHDTELRGFVWSEGAGWIVLNCADTTSGCSTANGNFKVANNGNGLLSGYAWGENTGWINFGPFTNASVSRVQIDANGEFGGSLGSAGYAWSENFGWIVFDCGNANSCVVTDWAVQNGGGSNGGGAIGGGGTNQPQPLPTAACSLSANPNPVLANGASALIWSSNVGSVSSASLTSSSTGNIVYPNSASGSVVVNPGQTTTYTATFTGSGATGTAVCSTTLTVSQTTVPPTVPTPPVPPTTPTVPTAPNQPNVPTVPQTPNVPTSPSGPSTLPSTPTIPSPSDEFGCTGNECTVTQPLFTLPDFSGIQPESVRKAAQAVAVAALVAGAAANIPGLIFRLQNLFLAILGYKKKRRNWGVVYDSVTKQPLDPAYVTLTDLQGNEVASSITDLDGRYGFLVAPGIYRMSAGKTHYAFPSTIMAGRMGDELYTSLYFGGEIEIKRDDEVITRNIPMDPTETDWNEVAKREQKRFGFFKKADIVFHKIVNVLFWIGFALGIFSVALVPVTFNFVVLGIYIVFLIINLTGIGGRKYGFVFDAEGKPLAFGVIRIFNAEVGNEIAHKVINANGKYYAIVPKGRYFLTIERKNPDGTYTKVLQTPPMDVKNGIIKKDFKL